MAKLTLSQKIIQFLKNNPNQKFTARQIAEAIYALHTDDFKAKRAKFNDDTAFIQQLVAEIGSSKPLILNKNPNIQTQDEPRPRLYWYETDLHQTDNIQDENSQNNEDNHKFNEHQLYPLLMQYLHNELDLYCLRIDEKSSSNTRGKNGNQWLHPDIVAMQALAKDWHIDIQSCIQGDIGQNIRLWSFEVKKELNDSNVRSSFFQAVSNSSWANEGYLVATAVHGKNTMEELRILSALHGIGVIILNIENIMESKILLPAQRKAQVDWQSANRIIHENKDFKTFIEYVATYKSSGKIFKNNWQQ